MLAKLKSMEKKVDENGNSLREFKMELEKQRELDIYAFADQSERADYASNLLKCNSVLLTGINNDLITREMFCAKHIICF